MIFLTLGTHQPFDRLVAAVDEWCALNPSAPVFGQVPLERGSYRPSHFEVTSHLHIDAYRTHFRDARFVVAHAGMGSIITAMSLCQPILLFPRRAHLNEQRNDHQLATVRRFEGKAGIHVAEDRAGLIATMDKLLAATEDATGPLASSKKPVAPFAESRFVEALRAAIVQPQSS